MTLITSVDKIFESVECPGAFVFVKEKFNFTFDIAAEYAARGFFV